MMDNSESTRFYGNTDPLQLVNIYGSPLYVYNEAILRNRCREMKKLIDYPAFHVNYSTKANSNLRLLEIIRSEGLHADAMSPGEIYLLLAAGFPAKEIFYIGNNVSDEELLFAYERKITISVDSLSQLERLGRLCPGGKVAFRINPGVGIGHHAKVVTGGARTKFGINLSQLATARQILTRYQLRLVGINQHIGSLFLDGTTYLEAVRTLLTVAAQYDDLEFVDLGGGFGIPYQKQKCQPRLNLDMLHQELSQMINLWVASYGKQVEIIIEPGRYPVAESGVLLGRVHAVKENTGTKYIGTDIGMNVLLRPVLYDAYHDIEVYRRGRLMSEGPDEVVTVVGNICESGDIMAKDRELPVIRQEDILGLMDAGAYGYVMSSNYNNRLRPAEVLIQADGNPVLIRRREKLDDLLRGMINL